MSNQDTRDSLGMNLVVLAREVTEISTGVKHINKRLEEMEEKMDNVKDDLARYRGIVGGILWVGGLLWAGLVFFKDWWR